MKQPETNTLNDWHRYMAIETNNMAWALSIKPRSKEDDVQMLNAAHASAFHWQKIGTDDNNIRATMLLAEVHGLLGNAVSALGYAQEVERYYADKTIANWERAFVYIVLARAHKAGFQEDLYRTNLLLAQKTVEMISDQEERDIVNSSLTTLEKP